MDKPIFEEHIGLVKSVVRSFDRSCPPQDSEFFAVACMALMRAISAYDQSKSKFSYWATKIIKNAIIAEMRKRKRFGKSFSSLSSEQDIAENDRTRMPLELADLLSGSCEQDTPCESENKRMLRRHYLDGVSMAEIAREVGFTRENVRQKVNKAIKSIRKKHSRMIDDHVFWLTGSPTSGEV